MRFQGQRGFSLVELALVLVVMGLIFIPLTRLLQESSANRKTADTVAALESVRDSLLSYAARNKGCLPHAADFEGGIPNTNIAGVASVNDTGSVRAAVAPATGGAGQRAGDVPWTDIGATGGGSAMALDGDQNRMQYYVAAAYTSPTQTRVDSAVPGTDNPATRDDCPARVRPQIESWDNTARYSVGDVVSAATGLFVATSVAPAVGVAPPTADWALFAGGSIPAWSSTAAYTVGAYVSQNGIVYRALQASDGTTTTTTTTGNGNGNGNGNNGNGNGNNGNGNGNTTTTTTAGGNPQSPSSAPTHWRAVGLPGFRPTPAWQAGGDYRRGEMVTNNGRTFRMIAAGTSNVQPVVGATGPAWRDVSTPAIINGVAKSLETRIGPLIDQNTNGQNNTASLNNVFVLIAPGTDLNTVEDRPALRDTNHRTCTNATNCAAWTTLNDTNVDNRTFSQTPDRQDNPNSPDTVLAVSYAEYQAYLQRHGLIAEPVQY